MAQTLRPSRSARPAQVPLPARIARPIFLNPLKIGMPVGALTSILHRTTGVLLALTLPVAVYLLGQSLKDAAGYGEVTALFTHWAVKSLMVVMVWTLAHHVLAGMRHMLMDVDMGSPLHAARRSAWAVNLGGVAVAVLVAGVLL